MILYVDVEFGAYLIVGNVFCCTCVGIVVGYCSTNCVPNSLVKSVVPNASTDHNMPAPNFITPSYPVVKESVRCA